MANDIKLDHAREFTNIENTTLDVWLQLENANLDAEARAVLDAGLMWEHYTSLLDNDADKRALHEITQAANLATVFNAAVAIGQEALRSKSGTLGTPPVITETQG
jgi:hypothetical protein